MLIAIQAIQIVNLVPLFADPTPMFLPALVTNAIIGALALPVACTVWARKNRIRPIAAIFAAIALIGAAYFEYLVSVRFGESFLSRPMSLFPIIMAINLAVAILLALPSSACQT